MPLSPDQPKDNLRGDSLSCWLEKGPRSPPGLTKRGWCEGADADDNEEVDDEGVRGAPSCGG